MIDVVHHSADAAAGASRRGRPEPRRSKVIAAAGLVALTAGGTFLINDAVEDLSSTVSCGGIVMGPGDTCSVAEHTRSGPSESWSPAGAPPIPPAGLRGHPTIKVLDADHTRALNHGYGWRTMLFGVVLVLPAALIAWARVVLPAARFARRHALAVGRRGRDST